MPAGPTLSHLDVSLPGSSSPTTSGVGQDLFRSRLQLFSKILFVLCLGFYLLGNLLYVLVQGASWWFFIDTAYNLWHLGACGVLGGMWLLSSARSPSYERLLFVDAAGVVLVCLAYSLVSYSQNTVRGEYQALLGLTNTLITRAILIPCRAAQTFWIGVAAAIPVAVVGLLVYQRPEIQATLTSSVAYSSGILTLWCVVSIIVSTVTSRVIYGLRKEATEARKLGQYTLEEKIGSGGMGEVYRARHVLLRRPTAVKLLRSDLVGERNIARFEREVQLTSRLTHPNTIAIYDFGRTPQGVFYYAMEYLPGLTLEELVRTDGLQPAGRVIHILSQVCASLKEAHGLGLIHRDIKAANVILCERGGVFDIAKVVDFGLVKDLEGFGDASISAVGTITGTPHYLSPESIRAPGSVDARSDLYAVGVLGYLLLTGKQVFEAQSFVEICGHHLHTPPLKPSARTTASLPTDLEVVILDCLEKDPARRPQSALALLKSLGACEARAEWTEEQASRWWATRPGQVPSASSETLSKASFQAAPTQAVPVPGVPVATKV